MERAMLRAGAHRVCGMDEVGRGALAGPVAVGVVVVDSSTSTAPRGLRDSKLLRPALRESLVPRLRSWCFESAVGYSDAAEIDEFGLITALGLAGLRALNQVGPVDHIILDGNHNWLAPAHRLSGQSQEWLGQSHEASRIPSSRPIPPGLVSSQSCKPTPVPVTTIIGGDRSCSSVAAASVLAKVDRDALLIDLDGVFPGYGWDANKGYATPQHTQAIRERGPCEQHRRSWNLPTKSGADET